MPYKDKKDQAKAAKKHYENNKEEIKERAKLNKVESVGKNKQFIWDYLKESQCKECGEKDPIVLQFDHLGNKKGNISDMTNSGCSLKTLNEEIDKCQILCANCHLKKTAKELDWYKNIIK